MQKTESIFMKKKAHLASDANSKSGKLCSHLVPNGNENKAAVCNRRLAASVFAEGE